MEKGELFCNKCGRKLRMENGMLIEDVLQVKKAWGYFSKKDLRVDAFNLCEDCYDAFVKSMKISPEQEIKNEVM